MENFLGKDGFTWWVGIIETRVDPLGIGRCRCRIFGWHSSNKSELPTEELPWATPMLAINNSKSFSVPSIGDWVVGFFMDGESAQAPIMMGVLPGMKQNITTDLTIGDASGAGDSAAIMSVAQT